MDAQNVEELCEMDFVFLCLDKGTSKEVIVPKLEDFNIRFCDVDMGLNNGALDGIVRATTSTEKRQRHVRSEISFGDAAGGNKYDHNIQIAELNAFNAALGRHPVEKAVSPLPGSQARTPRPVQH